MDGICTLYNPKAWRLMEEVSIPLESGEEGKVIVGAVTITTLQMCLPPNRGEHVALVCANAHVGWERNEKWMEILIVEMGSKFFICALFRVCFSRRFHSSEYCKPFHCKTCRYLLFLFSHNCFSSYLIVI